MTTMGLIWAVTLEYADSLRRLAERLGSLDLAARELAAVPSAAADPPKADTRAGAVAVIPIYGGILARQSWYGTSAEKLAALVRAAGADGDVKAIVLDVASPGGEVYGVEEAAAVIREARKTKPVVAVANHFAASAAYWLASQATEVYVTPSGEAGSIGIYGMHVDWSGALDRAGLKVTLIKAGKYKAEGNPTEPLSEAARVNMQASVDRYYEAFVRDVARGRRVSVDVVRAGFGEGRVVGSRAAVEEGMADGVGTLEEGIRRAGALATARRRDAESVASAIATRVRLVE